ncbi:tryptophan transporter [Clostridium botulinum]|uniref:Tryptophan transporter n=1 Tax=Clostridium botulinum C/D str. DC5 TaxID=1443128 RepID=A0A0A0IDL6_CLOBO|nr:tryptophan transporter [Clostridium botulinum]KEI00238.1 tryptophan transporter [Clostridium botulinum C/D str. BKT75002]KEI07017.1 tryptophan transporter [Clostridium botulinum C/D str. BKT2873]KGM94917.1 tryptophan transporter [Clostridium botulinum D str. CCUG 7971]KGM99052.1 tryptophan transporter [Clostridium botulinum C/D str. DC5]KOC47352.1 tryptophan transporter [Clostridium botulinum]
MKTNFKRSIINSLLLAIGFILHQIAPPIFFGMKPDLSLIMMFIIILLNDDYKTTLITGILYGILTALTTTFPGGQPANLIDKILTSQIIYLALIPFRNKFNNQGKLIILTAIGTMISGAIFIFSVAFLIGINQSISSLFLAVVLPATLINSIIAPILFNGIKLSLKHSKTNIF